jgi:hypothetical protein
MDIIFKSQKTKPAAEAQGRRPSMAVCIVLLLILSLISGCTAKIISRPADSNLPARGIAYHLPATELSYVMTFRLVDCRGAIEITDTAIEQRIVPDRGAGAYLIDSSRFSTFSKTIPLARITIANGLLTNISYDAKDNTAEIIKGGATLLGDVIAGASSVNLSSLGGMLTLLSGSRSVRLDQMVRSLELKKSPQREEASVPNMCNQATQDIMDEHSDLLRHLKTTKRNLYAAEDQLIETRDKGAADKIQIMENIIKRTKERLSELDQHLTVQYRKPLIVESGKCDTFGDITLESAPFTKWFGDKGDNNQFRKQFQTWIEENKLSYTIGNCNAPVKKQGKTEMIEGLYYRIPAQCKLEITRDTLVLTNHVELMQCGRSAAVEITNGAFQDNSHRIEFDPASGEIKTFEFRDNQARASEALSSADEAVKKVAK